MDKCLFPFDGRRNTFSGNFCGRVQWVWLAVQASSLGFNTKNQAYTSVRLSAKVLARKHKNCY